MGISLTKSYLKNCGICDVVLDCFISYLSNRLFSVTSGDAPSMLLRFFKLWGYPRLYFGSPVLYLYMLTFGLILCRCAINYNSFNQLNVPAEAPQLHPVSFSASL